jgi:hypothetical protein
MEAAGAIVQGERKPPRVALGILLGLRSAKE